MKGKERKAWNAWNAWKEGRKEGMKASICLSHEVWPGLVPAVPIVEPKRYSFASNTGHQVDNHFSPNSLLLGVLNALKNGRLGAGWSGRVPGRLVSHFLSFVSQFSSFVSQAGCLWSGSGNLLGLTPADTARLERFSEWEERETALREGTAIGQCASQDTNTRNVPYILLCLLPVAATIQELIAQGKDQTAFVEKDIELILDYFFSNVWGVSVGQAQARLASSRFRLPCGVAMARVYERLNKEGLFMASEGIYTSPAVLTALRIQRAYAELLGRESPFGFLTAEGPEALAGVAALWKAEERIAQRVADAKLSASAAEHLVSGSVLYALMLGKKSWFHRTEGQTGNAPMETLAQASRRMAAAAEAYARHKELHLHTAQACATQGVHFTPMVAECTGTWDPAAIKLLFF